MNMKSMARTSRILERRQGRELPVRPEWPKRKVGLVRLLKVLMLSSLLAVTTFTLGLSGKTAGAAMQINGAGSASTIVDQIPSIELAYPVENSYGSTSSGASNLPSVEEAAPAVRTKTTHDDDSVAMSAADARFGEFGLTQILILAAIFFWLGLAAANVRRKGDKDNRYDQQYSDQKPRSAFTVVRASSVRN